MKFFQQRMDGRVNFYCNWIKYGRGFGNLTGEFWFDEGLPKQLIYDIFAVKIYYIIAEKHF